MQLCIFVRLCQGNNRFRERLPTWRIINKNVSHWSLFDLPDFDRIFPFRKWFIFNLNFGCRDKLKSNYCSSCRIWRSDSDLCFKIYVKTKAGKQTHRRYRCHSILRPNVKLVWDRGTREFYRTVRLLYYYSNLWCFSIIIAFIYSHKETQIRFRQLLFLLIAYGVLYR